MTNKLSIVAKALELKEMIDQLPPGEQYEVQNFIEEIMEARKAKIARLCDEFIRYGKIEEE